MTNEEILNIVKLKYSEAKLSEDGRIIMGESGHYEGSKFVAEALICIENNKIIYYHRKKDFLGYIIECKSGVEYEFKNIIELKHILKLEITREDIILYLLISLSSHKTFSSAVLLSFISLESFEISESKNTVRSFFNLNIFTGLYCSPVINKLFASP